MARLRVVSRTIVSHKYAVLMMNTETCEGRKDELILTGDKPANDEKALVKLQKQYNTDTEKVVAITGYTAEEKLYKLPEADFVKYATEYMATASEDEEA